MPLKFDGEKLVGSIDATSAKAIGEYHEYILQDFPGGARNVKKHLNRKHGGGYVQRLEMEGDVVAEFAHEGAAVTATVPARAHRAW